MTATEHNPPVDRTDWRRFDEDPLSPLLRSATQTFVTRGYHGTTTRMLAAAAGMSVPGLYHHFASKQTLIVAIMDAAMTELRERSQGALAEAGDDVRAQLDLHIECLALFHAQRQELALLASTELRSLDAAERDHHIAARDAQERMLVDILQRGIDQGVFAVDDPRQLARALATMSTGISQWFRAGGPLTPADVARTYVDYARRLTASAA